MSQKKTAAKKCARGVDSFTVFMYLFAVKRIHCLVVIL